MNDTLQTTLQTYAQSGWRSNPAVHQIVDGYAHYHAVLAITGSLFLLILIGLMLKFWINFKKIAELRRFKWPFEKKVYFWFGTSFTVVALFLALVVAANFSTAAQPLPGFKDSLPGLADTSYNAKLHQSFNSWIVSGNSTPPELVKQHIHHRRVFHGTRVAAGTTLLIVFTVSSIKLWRTLIALRNNSETKWTLKEAGWLFAGILSVAIALFMMIVVIANLQSAIVPIANTLQFG